MLDFVANGTHAHLGILGLARIALLHHLPDLLGHGVALGFEGLTAKMLVDAVTEPALRQRLADVLQEISTLASDIQEQNRMSMEFANSSLKMMEQVAISAGIESHSTYSPDTPRGATHSKDSSFEKLV